jgi:hypothetical protein
MNAMSMTVISLSFDGKGGWWLILVLDFWVSGGRH